ncbi:MAG UNVERIFIED_CONTAM: hypothetical protein LVR18_25170 [Planctomycetaceae bacterium]|jgi:hypothetical protein
MASSSVLQAAATPPSTTCYQQRKRLTTQLTPPRFTYSSAPGNFRLINFQNSTENILPTYVLVAQIFSDAGQRVVNWAAGNVVLPTPDQDQSITWNANAQQLGRGANKIQLDGGTGTCDSPRHAP